MMLVVCVVGFLILLYSAEFMAHDEDYNRFFAYMNLFIGSMLILVLADNLLLLYLGWEGVGLCSYLLIGFWYQGQRERAGGDEGVHRDPHRRHRAGVGLFLLFVNLGTLDIQELMSRAAQQWQVGSALAVGRGALAAGRRGGEIRATPVANLVAGRHGRPDTGERADPRRHYGDRRRLPDRAHHILSNWRPCVMHIVAHHRRGRPCCWPPSAR